MREAFQFYIVLVIFSVLFSVLFSVSLCLCG